MLKNLLSLMSILIINVPIVIVVFILILLKRCFLNKNTPSYGHLTKINICWNFWITGFFYNICKGNNRQEDFFRKKIHLWLVSILLETVRLYILKFTKKVLHDQFFPNDFVKKVLYHQCFPNDIVKLFQTVFK